MKPVYSKENFFQVKTMLSAWAILHKACATVMRCEEVMFSKVGITPQQYAVLAVFKGSKSPVTPTEVARQLDRRTNSITLIVDRMEKAGLIKRVRNLQDRRTIQLVMTKKGLEAFDRATKPGTDFVKEILSCLTEKELKIFINFLERIRQKAIDSPCGPWDGLRWNCVYAQTLWQQFLLSCKAIRFHPYRECRGFRR